MSKLFVWLQKRVTINDPEKGPTEIRLTQRVKTFYVDKWPEIKDVKGGRGKQ